MWKKFWQKVNNNLAGILGTVAFHMMLVIIFLIMKISSTKNLIDSIIMLEFEEPETREYPFEPSADNDIKFDLYVAEYLESDRSNIPVNIAEKVNEQIATDKYVERLMDEIGENRSEEWQKSQERLYELQEMESADNIIAESDTGSEPGKDRIFRGSTNIFYSVENRYHIRLPVPIYKCEGEGVVEVQILVDQKGFVVHTQIPDMGFSMNEICLAEAAQTAALRTRFNANFEAPLRQQGTITYYFQAQ